MQDRLLEEIDIKFQEIINYEKLVGEEPNIEFDFMDRVSKDDLLDKIDTLEKTNELSQNLILKLKREEDELLKGIQTSKQRMTRLKDEATKLEDKDIHHAID